MILRIRTSARTNGVCSTPPGPEISQRYETGKNIAPIILFLTITNKSMIYVIYSNRFSVKLSLLECCSTLYTEISKGAECWTLWTISRRRVQPSWSSLRLLFLRRSPHTVRYSVVDNRFRYRRCAASFSISQHDTATPRVRYVVGDCLLCLSGYHFESIFYNNTIYKIKLLCGRSQIVLVDPEGSRDTVKMELVEVLFSGGGDFSTVCERRY